MKRTLLFIAFFSAIAQCCKAQSLKLGDRFPDYIIRQIVNGPAKQLDVNSFNDKYLILNFWGTWCAPCLPEMDTLKQLQLKNSSRVQVLALANDNKERVKKYIARKPTPVWIAADTAFYLYQQFGFNSVGQSAILNREHIIVALVKTDSIDQFMIDRLLNGETVRSSAEIIVKTGPSAATDDLFQLDTTLAFSVSLRSYTSGKQTMGRRFSEGPFKDRRRSYINVCPIIMYKDAFGIVSENQLRYEMDKKKACDFSVKPSLFCFDILVKPAQKDSLLMLMQKQLNKLLPVKARMEKQKMEVWVLKLKTGTSSVLKESTAISSSSSFSGRGYEGVGVRLQDFTEYLANELQFPVVDETGLTGSYDISTENIERTQNDIIAALEKLGMTIEKQEREMPVMVIYE